MNKELRHDLNLAGLILLVLLAANNLLRLPFLVFRHGFHFLIGIRLPTALWQLFGTLVYAGAMVFTLFTGIWLWRRRPSFLLPLEAPRRDFLLPALGAGMGIAMVSNLAIAFLTALLRQGGIGVRELPPDFSGGVLATSITLFSLTVLPALLEELLFRGVLLQPLRKYGDRVAVVLSALLFALCHTTLPQALNAFVLGLVLGLFTVRTGSLLTSMALHFFYNCFSCAVSLLWLYRPTAGTTLASWLLMLFFFVQGIYCLFLLRRRFGRALWIAPYAVLRPGQVAASALCSVPLLAAGCFYIAQLVQNLYWT